MCGGDGSPYSHVTDGQMAYAMHAGRTKEREFRLRFSEDARALTLGEFGKSLVLERAHGVAVVVIAHPAFEYDAGARTRVDQLAMQSVWVEGRGGDLKHVWGN